MYYIYIYTYTAYYKCEFQWFAFRAVVSQLDLQLRSGPAVHIESLLTVAEKKNSNDHLTTLTLATNSN